MASKQLMKDLYIDIPAREQAPQTTLFCRLVYQQEADLKEKPYVFMLPGGPGSNHTFYRDYECLSDVCNVIFHDPRGCGLSDKGEPATYSMQNYIDDIELIRQHLQLPSVVVLGKSYGAMCALGYAIHYPDVVNKLILAAGVATGTFLQTAKENIKARGTKEQQKICDALFAGNFQNDEELAYFFGIMDTMYSYRKRHNLPVERPKPEQPFAADPLNLGFKDFLPKIDYVDELGTVTCPTLILVGKEDWITDPRYSKMMADGIKGSRLIMYDKSDHSMESDVPEQYFNDIRGFIVS